jgi:hypothetical protein
MSAKSFGTLFERLGRRAGMPFTIFPHMLRHACGYALANAGHDTRALQAWLGHKNIQHTVVRYTEMAPDRFKGFLAMRAGLLVRLMGARFVVLPGAGRSPGMFRRSIRRRIRPQTCSAVALLLPQRHPR